MKQRFRASFALAGLSVLMLTSCVSSKKYKASQAALAQARTDSAQLAQQVASLNQNIQSMDQKNKDLQGNLDRTTASYTSAQQNLGYYQTYFDKQQTSATATSQELTTAMTEAGVTDADLQATNGVVTVNLDEKTLFKNNSTTVSAQGKKVLDGIATVIKARQDLMVAVDNGDADASTATGSSSAMDNSASSSSTASSSSMDNSSSTASSSTASASTRSSSATRARSAAPRKTSTGTVARKAPRKTASGEGRSYSYSNKGATAKKSSASWALKTGRVNAVANSLIKSGVPKVHVVHSQQPAGATGTSGKSTIKVTLSPTMTDFNRPAATTTTSTSGTNQ